jgi:hypothetical protein
MVDALTSITVKSEKKLNVNRSVENYLNPL